MRPQVLGILALIAIGSVGSLTSCGSSPATRRAATRPLPLDDVRDRGVEGRLGVPLGTLVSIAGKVVPDTSRTKAHEPLLLRIEAVNGSPLTTPVEYPFRKAVPFIDVTAPPIGDRFEFRGYESGGFTGVPRNYAAPWQDHGFGFETEFLVLPPPPP